MRALLSNFISLKQALYRFFLKFIDLFIKLSKVNRLMKSFDFLQGRRAVFFGAIQGCLAPRSKQFTSEQKRESLKIVNDFLQNQSRGVHFKLTVFFLFIRFLSFFCGLEAIMTFLFDSPMPILRKGFWGLNTLVKLGVYGQASVYDDIGYKLKGNTNV